LEYPPGAHDEHEQVNGRLILYTPGSGPEVFEFAGKIF